MYRLHFTDASLAQVEALGLDRDAVRRVIDAGTKAQVAENRVLCRHAGIEADVRTEGRDYLVLAVRRETEWPRGPAELPYLKRVEGSP